MHYLSLALECTRAEVMRAVELAQHQLQMRIDKRNAVYRIESWDVLDKDAVAASLQRAQATPNACDRAEEAVGGYVGNVDYLRMNLRDVMDTARRHAEARNRDKQQSTPGHHPG